MFCILRVQERKRRLFHKNPPYRVEKTVIPKTAVFERLTVFSYSGRCDFKAVREHLRAFSKAVIFEQGSVLPAESGIFGFSSNELKARMLFNSAEEILLPFKNKRTLELVLSDKTGAYSSFLERAVLLAGRVTVLTDNPIRYRYVSDEIYGNTGAVTQIKEWTDENHADVLISLCSGGKTPMSVVIKNRRENTFVRLEGGQFTLPETLARYKPETVGNYPFASALFTLCSIRALGKLRFDTFSVNSRHLTLDSVAKMLDTLLII